MPWKQASSAEFGFAHDTLPVHLAGWQGGLYYSLGQEARKLAISMDGPLTSVLRTSDDDVDITLDFEGQGKLSVAGRVRNLSDQPLFLDRLALTMGQVQIGEPSGRLAFFKNGYQSWSETRAFSAGERAMVPILRPLVAMQDNLRNLSSGLAGEFTSDMFGVLGNLDEDVYLLLGQAAGFGQFVYVRAALRWSGEKEPSLGLVFDFGGKMLPPGEGVDLDWVVILAGRQPNELQDCYLDLLATRKAQEAAPPVGYCTWYYYWGKVTEADVKESLAEAGANWPGCQVVVLDDGYSTALGDWLSINSKFPGGMNALADRIQEQGLTPGLWLAPFVAVRGSDLVRDHPEWILRDAGQNPAVAGWNPNWGLGGVFYGLDTTHPEFQDYVQRVVETMVHEWGYRYLKLDFVYGACLPGLAHDRSLSAAERLSLGYRLIREAAGEDVFLLGCGSPLGPAVGLVDGMRIGPDVAPYWFAKYRYHLTRDPHALCTKFAIRSILNRCQMHRKLWLNDPDCLLMRETETKLSPAERMSLVHAAVITGGMLLVSDRLATYPDETWTLLADVEDLARECDRGRAWALDYMETDLPELVYNTAGFVAIFNHGDHAVHKQVPAGGHLAGLVSARARLRDVWTGREYGFTDGDLDLGEMAAHSSLLLRVCRSK